MLISVVSFFFFSSRRRHTRLQGDWSSDVCSSDLQYPEEEKATAIPLVAASERGPAQTRRACTPGVVGPRHGSTTPSRSGLERPARDGDSPVSVRVRPLAVFRVTRDTCNPA